MYTRQDVSECTVLNPLSTSIALMADATDGRVGLDDKYFYYRTSKSAKKHDWKKIPVEFYKNYILLINKYGTIRIMTQEKYRTELRKELNARYGTH